MQNRELTEMHTMEVNHWWYAGKRLLFRRLLADRLARPDLRILDIGAGTGAAAMDFGRDGWICASDRSRIAIAYARERGVRTAVVADATAIPFADESFDLVLALDIIEHVDDDEAMLRDIARVLRPGGAVAIHVPAWPSLWCGHDEILEHKRRYTRRGLARTLSAAGLEAEYLGWTGATILVPAAVVRLSRRWLGAESDRQDAFSLPRPLNSAMLAVYRAEAAIAARSGLPFGLSLAAIARVP
jgi:SAM-dependent methyltransferase